MQVNSLRPNPKNPRKITDQKLAMLKKSLLQFGDLSGIVFNRRTMRIVGGHQRLKVLPRDAEIYIDKIFDQPTRCGTVAKGTVYIPTDDGEEEGFTYREVDWDDVTEKAANIAANQHGGEWDLPQLSEWLLELDHLNVDLSGLGFDSDELENIMAPLSEPRATKESQEEKVQCPTCGEKFTASQHKGNTLD